LRAVIHVVVLNDLIIGELDAASDTRIKSLLDPGHGLMNQSRRNASLDKQVRGDRSSRVFYKGL
jgi:hypothetical protein